MESSHLYPEIKAPNKCVKRWKKIYLLKCQLSRQQIIDKLFVECLRNGLEHLITIICTLQDFTNFITVFPPGSFLLTVGENLVDGGKIDLHPVIQRYTVVRTDILDYMLCPIYTALHCSQPYVFQSQVVFYACHVVQTDIVFRAAETNSVDCLR